MQEELDVLMADATTVYTIWENEWGGYVTSEGEEADDEEAAKPNPLLEFG
jgi:hypothetical protein